MKTLATFLLAIIGMCALGFALTYNSWAQYNFFAPKYEATRRATFEQSASYNQGMIRDMEDMQMEYEKADSEHKQALRAIILHRFSVYPQENMPANLRNFYNNVKGN